MVQRTDATVVDGQFVAVLSSANILNGNRLICTNMYTLHNDGAVPDEVRALERAKLHRLKASPQSVVNFRARLQNGAAQTARRIVAVSSRHTGAMERSSSHAIHKGGTFDNGRKCAVPRL